MHVSLLSVEFCLYSLQTSFSLRSCLTTRVCLSRTTHKSVSIDINFFFFFFGTFFSMELQKNGAQQHSVRQTNTCMSLVKNPSCFLSTSFHLCWLQQNIIWHNLTFLRNQKFPLHYVDMVLKQMGFYASMHLCRYICEFLEIKFFVISVYMFICVWACTCGYQGYFPPSF